MLAHHLRDHRTQAAEGTVLLDSHDGARGTGGLNHGLGVKRLDAVHVEHRCRDALLGQQVGSVHGMADHLAGSDERYIGAAAYPGGAIHLERALVLGVHVLDRVAAHADVGRLVVGDQGPHELGGLEAVARQIHAHVGNRAHGGDILRGVMAHAQGAVGHAARDADELDVGIGVRDVDLALLIRARGHKGRRRGGPGLLAARSHAGGDAHQVLLGNADLDGLLGILIKERRERCGAAGIGAQDDDILIGLRGLEQRVADNLAIGDLVSH